MDIKLLMPCYLLPIASCLPIQFSPLIKSDYYIVKKVLDLKAQLFQKIVQKIVWNKPQTF
ncbi:hypothetical protein VF14_16515 [Nostoc linckia z18]|uniref:Uncharacterized protein n=2 Tax=Nostoc linckia TaxID=92942 RepID=A0A9Q5ZB63_NOSLI|nr:hypothetical protein VF05_19920 [Nostoc linckia z3]PHJ68758.1 hypothetical protein VF02_02490 [Nostoc linckia z1]PHJ74068.1 hypothetical protein VF03_15670 [Nostoc linckia z2]PHJ83845.1 hypothetical protein VF06_10945 [Nostoc linckia z4]PHJ91535.1 hypothetical protein VF07_05395 [Nostoc linckia z6]PHJ95313.1 hypothetical protein VF04_19125 [Nostoc linckia z7]PHK02683.1 hypothetical protein VF08_17795 [Nostoc linckia z8]PHK09037.1 hypothetical protein VF09_17120 [Nostoc linckia z9]PHK1727